VRTHRRLLVNNYVVTFQDNDSFQYMEWSDLKRWLSRPELIKLVRAVKSKQSYVVIAGARVNTVQFV